MKKPFLITLLCASLMLVTPFTTVAQENTVSNNLPEQPNDVEGLVAQIRIMIDEILQKYGHISMVRSLCNMILGLSDIIGRLIYCIFLIIIIPLSLILLMILSFILFLINPYYVMDIILLLTGFIWLSGAYFAMNCPELFPWFWDWSFKSIYTMLETKDNINTFDGCPCLQE